MRIALVEWWPRICGATDCAIHLSAGGARGDVVDLVTFSRNGRPRKDWVHPELWKIHRQDDAVEVLNGYDLVIMSDVACFAPEVYKTRDGGPPWYVETMRSIRAPWTAIFYGNPYGPKHDPTIAALLESPSFAGKLVTHRGPKAIERFARFGFDRFHVDPYAPYDFGWRPVDPPARRTRSLIMTARIMTNKGQDVATAILGRLKGDVEVWGYNAYGFPSIAYCNWELATALGYRTTKPALRRGCNAKHPNAYKFYTGAYAARAPDGQTLRYHDAYETLADVDWSPAIHVSLANETFGGILEFASLDAVAAGAVVVAPEHALEYGRWKTIETIPYRTGAVRWNPDRGEVRDTTDPHEIDATVRRLNELLMTPVGELAAIAAAQRAEIERLHSPRRHLREIVAALGGMEKRMGFDKLVVGRPGHVAVEGRAKTAAARPGVAVGSSSPSPVPRQSRPRAPGDRPLRAVGCYIFAGGFTVGVSKHFEVLAHLEDGPFGVATTRLNFPNLPIYERPAEWPIDDLAARGVDFVYSNPPCAPWSRAADRRKLGSWELDPRLHCVIQDFGLVEKLRPRVWCWESVRGAFTNGRPLVDRLTKQAREMGYAVTYLYTDAQRHGIAQRRKRFFMVVHDVAIDFEMPRDRPVTVGQALATVRSPTLTPQMLREDKKRWAYWHKLVKNTRPGEGTAETFNRLHADVVERAAREKLERVPKRPSFQEIRLDPEGVSYTMTGGMKLLHPAEDRFLSPEEYAALSSYPLRYKFAGSSPMAWYGEIAKAVMPRVGEYLARMVAAAIRANRPAGDVFRFVDVSRDAYVEEIYDPVDASLEPAAATPAPSRSAREVAQDELEMARTRAPRPPISTPAPIHAGGALFTSGFARAAARIAGSNGHAVSAPPAVSTKKAREQVAPPATGTASAAPRRQSPRVEITPELAPGGAPPPAAGETSGDYIGRLLQLRRGWTDEQVAACVRKHYAGRTTKPSDVAWNRRRLRGAGANIPDRVIG